MTLILVLVGIRLQGFALWDKNVIYKVLSKYCCNVLGATPASDRMGYAQTNVSSWPATPIGGLLAYNFKV